jgi:hypothetical protein
MGRVLEFWSSAFAPSPLRLQSRRSAFVALVASPTSCPYWEKVRLLGAVPSLSAAAGLLFWANNSPIADVGRSGMELLS